MTEEVTIMSNLLKQFEDKQRTELEVPAYHPGDTLIVEVRVEEGSRVRTQTFEGVVIGKRDRGVNTSFTLRKKTSGIGIERTFNLHSPLLKSIKVKRVGKVRQSKLYYLRTLTAKKARIAEKMPHKAKAKASVKKTKEA